MSRLAKLREIERHALSSGQVTLALIARHMHGSLIMMRITLAIVVGTAALTVAGMLLR